MLEGEEANLPLLSSSSSGLPRVLGEQAEARQLGQDQVQLPAKLPVVVAGNQLVHPALQALHKAKEAATPPLSQPPEQRIEQG